MNLVKSRLTIDDFILEMMRLPSSQLQLSHLQDWVGRLDLKDDLFQQHIDFCSECYKRQLLCRTSRFDMLILCWKPEQSSTIHDHADSLNVTRVYQGVLTSKIFEYNHNSIRKYLPMEIAEEYLDKDQLVGVERQTIHQLANTSNQNLVTLHIYAPPLREIQVYCPVSGEKKRVPVRYALEDDIV